MSALKSHREWLGVNINSRGYWGKLVQLKRSADAAHSACWGVRFYGGIQRREKYICVSWRFILGIHLSGYRYVGLSLFLFLCRVMYVGLYVCISPVNGILFYSDLIIVRFYIYPYTLTHGDANVD